MYRSSATLYSRQGSEFSIYQLLELACSLARLTINPPAHAFDHQITHSLTHSPTQRLTLLSLQLSTVPRMLWFGVEWLGLALTVGLVSIWVRVVVPVEFRIRVSVKVSVASGLPVVRVS